MPERCDDCDAVLYPGDWRKRAVYNDELLRLCETCAAKRDAGPLVAVREKMLRELRNYGLAPRKRDGRN